MRRMCEFILRVRGMRVAGRWWRIDGIGVFDVIKAWYIGACGCGGTLV